jgi:hypothetical protein
MRTATVTLACLLNACSFVFPPGHGARGRAAPAHGRCLPIAPIVDASVVAAGVAIPVVYGATIDKVGAGYIGGVTVPIGALFLIPTIYGFRKYARCEQSPRPATPGPTRTPDEPAPDEHCGVDGSCTPLHPQPRSRD